jgi:hypothetical protein
MEQNTPAGSTPAPLNQPTIILVAGTQDFGAFLAGTIERINAPLRAEEARNQRLQLIGEIVEVAAKEEIYLTPSQILLIADAAEKDITIGCELSPATFDIIINGRNQNGSKQ